MSGEREERKLVKALRAGDEAAFRRLIEMYHAMLVRVARMYVSTQAAAEEVAQETWLAVLEGIDRFEGRSSLKTWIFRILTNRAKTRGMRERSHPSNPTASRGRTSARRGTGARRRARSPRSGCSRRRRGT